MTRAEKRNAMKALASEKGIIPSQGQVPTRCQSRAAQRGWLDYGQAAGWSYNFST
jgi:hypothetical protein